MSVSLGHSYLGDVGWPLKHFSMVPLKICQKSECACVRARERVSELTSETEGGKTVTNGAGKGAFSISASLSATSTTIKDAL